MSLRARHGRRLNPFHLHSSRHRRPLGLSAVRFPTLGCPESAKSHPGVEALRTAPGLAGDARTLFINQAKGDSLAEMMLTSMGELIGYDGEFAILSSTPTATNQNAWIAFMKAR